MNLIKAWFDYERSLQRKSILRLGYAAGMSASTVTRRMSNPFDLSLREVMLILDELNEADDERKEFFNEAIKQWATVSK